MFSPRILACLCTLTLVFTAMPALSFAAQNQTIQLAEGLDGLSVTTWSPFIEHHGTDWTVEKRAGRIHRVYGSGISLDLSSGAGPAEIKKASKQFFSEYAAQLLIGEADLRPIRIQKVQNAWIVVYGQWHEGVRVMDARADLRIVNGKAVLFGADVENGISIETKPAIPQEDVADFLDNASVANLSQPVLAILPVRHPAHTEYQLVWEVVEQTRGLYLRHVLDARTGELVTTEDMMRHAALTGDVTGLIHESDGTQQPESLPVSFAQVTVLGEGVAITGTDGSFSLEAGSGSKTVQTALIGPYAQVFNAAGADAFLHTSATVGTPLSLEWTDSDSTPAERDAFYHVMAAHSAIKSIDSSFSDLDYVLPVTVNADSSCQANWDGTGLSFSAAGGTCENMATFADVVFHEYGHAITEKIYDVPDPESTKDQPPEMLAEAYSDYFACTITGDPELFENVDSTGAMDRNIDVPNLVYPDDLTGDPHSDALILSGALWDMRKNLVDSRGEVIGKELADNLFHGARAALPMTYEDYFLELLVLDDDDGDLGNGTPHAFEIYQAFGIHGIGPGVGIRMVSYEIQSDTNDNGYPEPGEAIEVGLTLFNRYSSTSDITLTLSTSNQYATVTRPVVEMPFVESWGRVSTPEPFEIEISENAPFGEQILMELLIDEGSGTYTNQQTFGITVGTFTVLLVDDDGGDVMESFFLEPLTNSGYSFAIWDVDAIGSAPTFDTLNKYSAIVWNTGNATEDTITQDEQEAIASYLDGGGSMFISGQHILNEIGETDFATDYLHLFHYDLDMGATVVWAPGTDELTNGIVIDPTEYSFPDASDQFTPDGTSSGILYNHIQGYCALKHPMQSADLGHRLIFFAFPFEAIPGWLEDPSNPSAVLKRMLDFLIPTRVVETSPEHEGMRMGINEPLVVTFSKAMNPATVEFLAIPDPGGWSVTWSEDQKVATFAHEGLLECCGAQYTFQITAAEDTFGNSLQRGNADNPWNAFTAYAPGIESISPPKTFPGQETEILIHGAEFLETPEVFIGDEQCTEVSWRGLDTITALAPALSEGLYDVTVINPDTQSGVLSGGFEVTEDAAGDDDDDDDDDDSCGCSVSNNSETPNKSASGIMVLFIFTLLAVFRFGLKTIRSRRV